MLERAVIALSHQFMRIPLVRECMALAWTEGKAAGQYAPETDNPYYP